LGLAEKTFVLFTSDNGGAPRHGADNGPLRGGKGSTFEGGMRVPTIAWWPGKIPAGSECDEVMCTMDVMPTLVSLAGGSIPTDRVIDGADVWPLVSGRPEAKTPHETFLYFRGFELQAVRHGGFKLILKSKQLYDLKAEIGEETDVARQHPQVVAEIHAIAAAVDQDLGRQALGPGCRTLGNVPNPKPLIPFDAE
jgi:arylsulfatase A